MTIEQLAAELGVTRQAISNRIRRAGISMEDIAAGKQGKNWQLTDKGADMLRDLVKGKKADPLLQIKKERAQKQKVEQERVDLLQKIRRVELEKEEVRKQLEAAKSTIEQQRFTLQSMAKTIEAQTKTIESLNNTNEALINTVQAQALSTAAQASTIKRLQDSNGSRPRGKWARFMARLRGEEPKNKPAPAGVVVAVEHEPVKDPGKAAGDAAAAAHREEVKGCE